MNRAIILVTLVVASLTTEAASQAKRPPPDPAVTACSMAAFKEYNDAKLVLQQQPMSMTMSIEATLSERRSEERYCLQVVRCVGGETTTTMADVIRATQFSRCLEDKSLEKYDAKRR